MDLQFFLDRMQNAFSEVLLIFCLGLGLSALVELFLERVLLRWARQTSIDWDEKVLLLIRRPLSATIFIFFSWKATQRLEISESLTLDFRSFFLSCILILWSQSAYRATSIFLRKASRLKGSVVNAQTLPIFEIAGKIIILTLSLYFFMLAWEVDVSGWLASAGVAGLVLGLAAQTTLSNLFAGVFILADSPYKLGDIITLENGTRGKVLTIGIRSTRLLTINNEVVIIPNAEIAATKLLNESGGPETFRVVARVEAAYGSDLDRVKRALLEAAESLSETQVDKSLEPKVMFETFGASGLGFQILVWTRRPFLRDQILDQLNTAIYQTMARYEIEIPYSKMDLYHYQGDLPMPARPE